MFRLNTRPTLILSVDKDATTYNKFNANGLKNSVI